MGEFISCLITDRPYLHMMGRQDIVWLVGDNQLIGMGGFCVVHGFRVCVTLGLVGGTYGALN